VLLLGKVRLRVALAVLLMASSSPCWPPVAMP